MGQSKVYELVVLNRETKQGLKRREDNLIKCY